MPIPEAILNKTLTSISYAGCYVAPYTFSDFASLTSVNAPNLRFIDGGSFYNCSGLSTFNFGSVIYIGDQAFCNTGLSGSLILPEIRYIGSMAFSGTSITSLTIKTANCVLDPYGAFPNTLTTVKVPSSSVDFYKSAPGWNNFADRIVAI